MSDFTTEQLEDLKDGAKPNRSNTQRSGTVTKPIVKREYVQAFAQDYGTTMVNERRLARDLERAYTMIEELRDDYRTRPYPYGEVARSLTRILEGE